MRIKPLQNLEEGDLFRFANAQRCYGGTFGDVMGSFANKSMEDLAKTHHSSTYPFGSHQMNFRIISSVFILSVTALCSTVAAQTYTLGYDQNRYDATLGGTVDIRLILTEEIANGETSRLAAGGNDGLFAFSADTDYSMFNGSARGVSFSTLLLNDLFTIGFSGSGNDVTTGPSNVSFEGAEDFANNDTDGETGVGGVMVSANVWEIELATLTFNADVDDTATLLQPGPHISNSANPFLFADSFEADIIYRPSQIVIGNGVPFNIPEPGSAVVLALLAGVGMLKRRRI